MSQFLSPNLKLQDTLGYILRIETIGFYRMKINNYYYLMPHCFQDIFISSVQENSE